MAAIYLRQIRAGKRTLEQVPEYWREQVRAMLEQKAEYKYWLKFWGGGVYPRKVGHRKAVGA